MTQKAFCIVCSRAYGGIARTLRAPGKRNVAYCDTNTFQTVHVASVFRTINDVITLCRTTWEYADWLEANTEVYFERG